MAPKAVAHYPPPYTQLFPARTALVTAALASMSAHLGSGPLSPTTACYTSTKKHLLMPDARTHSSARPAEINLTATIPAFTDLDLLGCGRGVVRACYLRGGRCFFILLTLALQRQAGRAGPAAQAGHACGDTGDERIRPVCIYSSNARACAGTT